MIATFEEQKQELHNTAQDAAQELRTLGQSAKENLQRFQHDAQEMARTKVIEPGMQFVKDASHRIEDQARRSAEMAKERYEQVSHYVADNPARALLSAFAGGVLLGLLIRR